MRFSRKDPVAHSTPTPVADRYGKTRTRRIDKWVGGSLAGLLIAGGIAFLAFGGLPTDETTLEFRDIAHGIDDNGTDAWLTFEVTAARQAEVVCEITALNPTYATVGARIIEFPQSDQRTRVFTEELRTHNLATSVTVKHCWVHGTAGDE